MSEDRRGGERRSGRISLRLHERRTGFDRRSPASLVGWYRDRPHIVGAVLVAVVLLNIADLVLTIRALGRGATEANPVMAALFELGPVTAGAFKVLVGLTFALIVWRLRRYRRVLEAVRDAQLEGRVTNRQEALEFALQLWEELED